MVVNRLGKIAIGCFGIIILLCILGAIFGGIIIKKLISGAIQEKTGVSVNVDDVSQGKLTYTDPKTGAKLNIGTDKIPDDFPKDFPIYPGASVTSSLSGNQTGKGNGFWLTLSTTDASEKIVSFYETNLSANGWTSETTTGAGTGTNWAVTKGNLQGYLTIEKPGTDNKTSILIVLGMSSQ